ncbi:MAG: hypothetical protein HW380_92 [Magnetococcales bacterium]|nr:hypothetical protein [Magnetococcales bacterium]
MCPLRSVERVLSQIFVMQVVPAIHGFARRGAGCGQGIVVVQVLAAWRKAYGA